MHPTASRYDVNYRLKQRTCSKHELHYIANFWWSR